VIARSLGYESEAAFGTAFKRVMGCSPRQYGRVQVPNPSSGSSSRDELVASGAGSEVPR